MLATIALVLAPASARADWLFIPNVGAGFGSSNVTRFMVNAIVGAPVGGTTGGGFRPYFSGGLGLLQTNVEDAESLFEVNNSEFGFNLGGGAMGFVSDHVGLRGDIRYFRALIDPKRTSSSTSAWASSTSGARLAV
jgi:opacity protein-like surface antigen